MRLGNIEFRYSKSNEKHELVQWLPPDERICIVIAFFVKHKEGYDMKIINDRFFQDDHAWIVGKHAFAFLNATFEVEKK